jgi:adenylosuccinate lyase
VEKLVVYPENMQRNLERLGGLIHSQSVLLALIGAGASREDAYGLVQRNAAKAWAGDSDFLAALLGDPEVRAALTEAELRASFDLQHHLQNVDAIFARVFGEPAENGINTLSA